MNGLRYDVFMKYHVFLGEPEKPFHDCIVHNVSHTMQSSFRHTALHYTYIVGLHTESILRGYTIMIYYLFKFSLKFALLFAGLK